MRRRRDVASYRPSSHRFAPRHHSHWQTVIAITSERPVKVGEGDIIGVDFREVRSDDERRTGGK